ncbi:hypothetical protein NLJ89_g9937 [Agrocybe chaxingu]|uniref:5'-3' exoribonuclease 1 D1 domain-containing protein n=1 Tax=Agrocybe chaxingu TaxID=84603 RepID=A0A9W8MT32_9AGAR|nr:hypothetical protein NLJ89_g9937 [Agrocybe chaxingu]
MLDGLRLVPALCNGIALGIEALARLPSIKTLPHAAMLGHRGVNVHGSESRSKSTVIRIENLHEGQKMEEIAKMTGEKTFVSYASGLSKCNGQRKTAYAV